MLSAERIFLHRLFSDGLPEGRSISLMEMRLAFQRACLKAS